MKNVIKKEKYFYYGKIHIKWFLNVCILFFLFIVLILQLVNKVNFVILECVEIFKPQVLQLTLGWFVPHAPLYN